MARGGIWARIDSEALSASWLSARTAIEPRRIEAMRRAGELIGVRPPGAFEHYYPVWQFDEKWGPLPAVKRVTAAARERGLGEHRLYEVLSARVGMSGDERLGSGLKAESPDRLIAAVRSAQP